MLWKVFFLLVWPFIFFNNQNFTNVTVWPVTGGACRCVWTGGGRSLLRGGRGLLQKRWPRPLRPRHLASLRGGGSVLSLLRHLEVPVLTWAAAADVKVTRRSHLRASSSSSSSRGSTPRDWLEKSESRSGVTTTYLTHEAPPEGRCWRGPPRQLQVTPGTISHVNMLIIEPTESKYTFKYVKPIPLINHLSHRIYDVQSVTSPADLARVTWLLPLPCYNQVRCSSARRSSTLLLTPTLF